MKKLLFSLAALALLLVSCQMQEKDFVDEKVTAPEIVATVETDSATRTLIDVDQLGEGTIYWTPSDEINIFYGTLSTHYTSQNTANATTAVFRTTDVIGSTESASTNIWGLYPYDANATSTGSAISTTLPATQYGVPDTFDDDLYITLAHSNSTALKFYNVCGGIKFSLSRGDITSITFKGNNNEPIAGDISLTFENGLPKATVVNGLTEITLTPKTGTTFAQNTKYYIVLLPRTLSGGFTMTFNTTSGSVGTFNYTANPITIKRSIFSRKAEIDTYATFVEFVPTVAVPEAVDLGLPSGLKWASFNIGASTPEEYGNHYAWGETEPNVYSWSSYKWCMGSKTTMTKYCSNSSYGYNGFTDTKIVLNPEDDAAHVNLGSKWRMPTDAEWEELLDNCTWAWKTQNGVPGRLVTGSNGNSIFLPAAGYRYGTNMISDYRSYGNYWSSSLNRESSSLAWYVRFNLLEVYMSSGYEPNNGDRCYGQSVRPVYGEFISVESVSMNKTALSLLVGSTKQLTVIFSPFSASVKHVDWSSSNASVATVSSNGVVTGLHAGTAYITVTSVDGGFTASCAVTVTAPVISPIAAPEAIDLGLPSGVKWASFNLGASAPEEYGNYYTWGETEPYYSSLDPLTWKEGKEDGYYLPSYKWCMGSWGTLTKYCSDSSYGYNGFTDTKTVLDLEDDAAQVNLGGNWRMPTDVEWEELIDNCTWAWKTQNDVIGMLVTGSNGNSIFLPAAGYRSGTNLYDAGSDGDYWSSSLYDYPNRAWSVYIDPDNFRKSYSFNRYYGLSVRPVSD